MIQTSFFSIEEIRALGFRDIGNNVKISRLISVYSPNQITIFDNTRIDDFCILSGGSGLSIGKHVHLSAGVTILGNGKISIGDYSSISVKTSIFSSNDDYSGQFLTNPTVPNEYRNVHTDLVSIGKKVIIGAHSVVLPGTVCEDNTAFGAFTLLKGQYPKDSTYAGIPAKKIKERIINHYELKS